MPRIPYLPKTVMNRIALFTGDHTVLNALKSEIDYDMLMRGIHPEKTLLYGPVQSGKTEAIVRTIQNAQFAGMNKVLVIQNSLSVLKQYQQRLSAYGVSFHVVGPQSHQLSSLPPNDVLLLINNRHRYAHYQKMVCKPTDYIALMDESDMYPSGSHPVADNARAQFYVTATPFHKSYKADGFFNKVTQIKPADDYTGLKDVVFSYKELSEATADFHTTTTGMMLINSVSRVSRMVALAQTLSAQYPETPILVLNTKKWAYYRGTRTLLKDAHISAIIDRYVDKSHIVFIANRLSLRGLSYASSDYTRHLTHQYSNFEKTPVTNCLQKMRMLGKRGSNTTPCVLYLGLETPYIVRKMTRVIATLDKATDKLSVSVRGFKIRPQLAQIV
jgi:hypothetical protein